MVYYQVRSLSCFLTCGCSLERLSLQPGVGTYSVPQLVTRVRARFQKYINMAIANHLSAHVMSKLRRS
jgi:hypothetical protein